MIKTRNILIISSNRLGDAILSSGLNEYFAKGTNSKLTFVCGPIPSEIFKYCQNIDVLITLNKKKFSFHWFILWSKLIFTKWEYIIDLRGTGISFFLFSKNKYRYIKKKNNIKEHKVTEITKPISGKTLQPHIKLSSNKNLKSNKLQEILELKKKYKLMMIAPSASWIGKIWPSERYLDLVNGLVKYSYFKKSLFIFVGPSNERYLVDNIFDLKRPYIFDLFGNSSLIEIFYIMKHCKLFIGNDSGLMHLAALAQIKTIGLFGPSNKFKYGPWGEGNICISSPKNPDELMGYKGFNAKKTKSLMLHLTTKTVLKEVILNVVEEK